VGDATCPRRPRGGGVRSLGAVPMPRDPLPSLLSPTLAGVIPMTCRPHHSPPLLPSDDPCPTSPTPLLHLRFRSPVPGIAPQSSLPVILEHLASLPAKHQLPDKPLCLPSSSLTVCKSFPGTDCLESMSPKVLQPACDTSCSACSSPACC
jgi:hypothetical protein